MIIWRGHGILILVFGIVGGLLTGVAVAAAYAATRWDWLLRMVGPANVWGAAIAIWLYGRTIGKTVTKTYLDPATQRYVDIKSSHTLFFIPPLAWAVMVAAMACVSTVRSFNQPPEDFMSDSQLATAAPGKAAYKEANRLIDMDKGTTAYGNTPDAEKLAADFSEAVMQGRELGVEKKKKKSVISLSHGKFLSYCRINPDSCVFMVHVPDLRNFTSEAKKFMVGLAWTVAREMVSDLRPLPQKLVVGVRGAFLYEEVVEGPAAKPERSNEDEDWQAGIEQRFSSSSATNRLETYFEPHVAGVVLPRLAGGDEPENKTPSMASPMAAAGGRPSPSAIPGSSSSLTGTPGSVVIKPAMNPSDKLEVLLKWFPTTKAGEVAGNADAVNPIALKYAGFVHGRVAGNPALGGLSLPTPCFSAYIHLRDDTAAFLLGLPAGSGLTPEAFKVIESEAWNIATMASAQMSPVPTRIAVVTYNEGRMDKTRIGSPQNPTGREWLIEQDLPGDQGKEVLAPFLQSFSKPLITMKHPLAMRLLANSRRPEASSGRAAPAAPPAPALAPASAPLLPTPVRDWKDATGRVMQASLERFTSPARDTGYFKRADGQGFEVPVVRLSAEDQAFIRGIAQKLK